ncbi:MAG: M23 family metallopeptidase, partial [Spirochaetota bacterium]
KYLLVSVLFITLFPVSLVSDLRQFHQFTFYQGDMLARLQPMPHKVRRKKRYKKQKNKPQLKRKSPYAGGLKCRNPFSRKLPIRRNFSSDSRNPHRGILFAYRAAGHVTSSQSGKVAAVSYMDGYENYIIIQHKRTFSTVYANMDHIIVSEGQVVKKGDMLGTLTKFKGLYFQVNMGRMALNPVKFLY